MYNYVHNQLLEVQTCHAHATALLFIFHTICLCQMMKPHLTPMHIRLFISLQFVCLLSETVGIIDFMFSHDKEIRVFCFSVSSCVLSPPLSAHPLFIVLTQ